MKITVLSACGKFYDRSAAEYNIREDNLDEVRLFMEPAAEKWRSAGFWVDPCECGILEEDSFSTEITAPVDSIDSVIAGFLADLETSLARYRQ